VTFVGIDSLSDGRLGVTDRIERRQCALSVADDPDPDPADADQFVVPVDDAVAVETTSVVFPELVEAYVRNGEGGAISEVGHFEERELSAGPHVVELSAPIKLYLRVDAPATVSSDASSVSLSLDRPETVYVGARSYHERPAATVTISERPEDALRAISLLGSALKTTSAERSYPTLRGHPPTIELGESFSAPAGLARPETGVRLELPPTHEAAFVAAPLAYYLGAEAVPGDVARLVTDDGFVHRLTAPDFETAVERTLKQTFFFDCLVRTEGYYPVDLEERRAAEADGAVPFDLAAAYDRPLAEQLATYLSVPFEDLEAHMPTWKLTGHVEPAAANAETLPYLIDDLAVVRTLDERPISRAEMQAAAIDSLVCEADADGTGESRGAPSRPDGPSRATAVPRATEEGSAVVRGADDAESGPRLVRPAETESLEQAWVGAAAPIGANKATVAAFRNRLAQEPTEGDLSIVVVCNAPEMLDEHETAQEVYESGTGLPFDVTVHRGLTTDRLRLVLESDLDFLHYIGHVDDGGFRCVDGTLDAAAADGVGVDTFLLNACRSYEQGMALIDGGAVGGVVTVDEVLNTGATAIGRTMARLLDAGFPLQAALNLASKESVVGTQYLVVGDGNAEVTHAETGNPSILYVERRGEEFAVRFHSYPTRICGLGSIAMPAVEGAERHFLTGSVSSEFLIDRAELLQLLHQGAAPVYVDGELFWSLDVSPADL